jgi:acetylornithine deacetylase/succinyl-diaminopimelate desuccinylase-like protein
MDAIAYARAHRQRFVDELCEFLRIPSVSAQPEHRQDVERAAHWLCQKLVSAGFPSAKVLPTPGHPVVLAEWLAAGPAAPTLLVYGHYDVQPPEPLDEWRTAPFEPTVVGQDVFARGASDDKGQAYLYVKAIEALGAAHGAPPVNVKCLFEGEEEIGSQHLEPFVREHAAELASDVAAVSDTHILGKDMPCIVYALRGIACVEIEVTGPDHDLHSGIYGGAVNNPLHGLCRIVARLHDAQGRVTIPGFYDRVRPLEPEERADLGRVPFDRSAWLAEAGVSADWGEAGYSIVERTTARPTLDLNGIWGGYTGVGAKTVLPSKAFAKLSMRLVADQDPAHIVELLRSYLAELTPPELSLELRSLHLGEGAVVARDSAALRAADQAYARAFGKAPVFVREGGSIPVVAMLKKVLGIDTVLMGFGLPDDRLHSPNEKFHLPNFAKGIETVIHFMSHLSAAHGPSVR